MSKIRIKVRIVNQSPNSFQQHTLSPRANQSLELCTLWTRCPSSEVAFSEANLHVGRKKDAAHPSGFPKPTKVGARLALSGLGILILGSRHPL